MVLLVVDVQEGITDDRLYAFSEFKTNIKRLIDEARKSGVEVVYVRHDDGAGSGFSKGDAAFEISSEVTPLEGEKIFDKSVNSSLHKSTGLLEYLNKKQVQTLIVPKGCNSTRANPYMDAQTTYRFFNDSMWPGRYAECPSLDETVSLIRG